MYQMAVLFPEEVGQGFFVFFVLFFKVECVLRHLTSKAPLRWMLSASPQLPTWSPPLNVGVKHLHLPSCFILRSTPVVAFTSAINLIVHRVLVPMHGPQVCGCASEHTVCMYLDCVVAFVRMSAKPICLISAGCEM